MHVLVPKRHREYELIYVLSPTTTPGGATKISDIITESMDAHEGKVLKVDLWGVRSLAYRIKGNKQGIYYYVRFVATQGMIEEMERRLKIAEAVLRFLTVRLSDKLVDPASFEVDEEEAAFKPIDEIVASLADKPSTESKPEAEAAAAEKPADKPAPEDKPKAESKPEDKPKAESKPEDKPATEEKPEVESKPEDKPKAESKPEDKPKATSDEEKKD